MYRPEPYHLNIEMVLYLRFLKVSRDLIIPIIYTYHTDLPTDSY